jgi:hypothetical protein
MTNNQFDFEIDHFFRYFKALKMFNIFYENPLFWNTIKETHESDSLKIEDEELNVRLNSKNRYLKSLLKNNFNQINVFKSQYESNSHVPQFNSFSPHVESNV